MPGQSFGSQKRPQPSRFGERQKVVFIERHLIRIIITHPRKQRPSLSIRRRHITRLASLGTADDLNTTASPSDLLTVGKAVLICTHFVVSFFIYAKKSLFRRAVLTRKFIMEGGFFILIIKILLFQFFTSFAIELLKNADSSLMIMIQILKYFLKSSFF
jgi:hypothetical protein